MTAVDNLSFKVESGEVLGFLGPNGAGKSTTMKMVTGFLAPSSGTINVCGHPVEGDARAAKQHIGYLPEGAPSYAEMTAQQFLSFIADVRQLTGSHRKDRIDTVIQQLHLEQIINRLPGPKGNLNENLKCLLVDSWYDTYLGVVILVRVINGKIKKNMKIKMLSTNQDYVVEKVGIFTPKAKDINELNAGEIGFITTGIKVLSETKVGDTICDSENPLTDALPGFKPSKPVVFLFFLSLMQVSLFYLVLV